MSLEISVSTKDKASTIVLSGEVDVSNADELRQAIAKLEEAQQDISVDMAEVPYIDSTGIGVLVGAANRAKEAGTNFSVLALQPNVARVIDLLDLSELLNIVEA